MSDVGFDHGPRLSLAEYERRLIALHTGHAQPPTPDQDRERLRAQLDLDIDFRLGTRFPADRREAMWAVRQRVERQRVRLLLSHVVRKIWPRLLARGATGLADTMAESYAEVLSPAELQRFLGLQAGEKPGLPIDVDQIRRG